MITLINSCSNCRHCMQDGDYFFCDALVPKWCKESPAMNEYDTLQPTGCDVHQIKRAPVAVEIAIDTDDDFTVLIAGKEVQYDTLTFATGKEALLALQSAKIIWAKPHHGTWFLEYLELAAQALESGEDYYFHGNQTLEVTIYERNL